MKDIEGYEGFYAITSCGKVWSYMSKKFLKPEVVRGGYLKVFLCKHGQIKPYLVHRLVAQAYIPNFDNKSQVNHKDENKKHNYISNLEWATAKENASYGSRTDRSARKRSKAVLCVETGTVYWGMSEAERQTGIEQGNISRCANGKLNTAGGFHWHFVEG